MKKKSILFILASLFAITQGAWAAETPQVIWCEGNSTLYFTNSNETYAADGTYDGQTITQVWSGDAVVNYGEQPQWNTVVGKNCTKVVFDQSFYEIKPTSLKRWFTHFYNPALQFVGLNYLNTSEVTDMSYMFEGSIRLKSLDLSSFNTGKVTTMKGMFRDCLYLTSLDLSSFNTQNVTDMSEMFLGCKYLTSLDLDNFNTSKVSDMSSMFEGSNRLKSLDLSSFNTENVTSIKRMFIGCETLTNLDLSRFKTEKVTDLTEMFSGCFGLTTLDLSSFNTQNVTSMAVMFGYCSALTSLDLSNFKTDNVKDMTHMFLGCSELKIIYCSNDWNTDLVEDDKNMFDNCASLVGGNGTAYDRNHIGKDYARIDREGTPGYFTQLYSIALDETSDGNSVTISEYNGKTCNVKLTRTIVPGSYNTLCLPFDVNNDMLKYKFGDDVELAQLSDTHMENGTLYFDFILADAITAGVPYLIYVSDAVESPITFNAVTVKKETHPVSTSLAKFTPVFDVTTLQNGNENILFLGANNTLFYPSTTSGAMKGFRAYFEVKGEAQGAKAMVMMDNSLTGVKTILNENLQNEQVYDLQGRMVTRPAKGLYIMNGKKVIIK